MNQGDLPLHHMDIFQASLPAVMGSERVEIQLDGRAAEQSLCCPETDT